MNKYRFGGSSLQHDANAHVNNNDRTFTTEQQTPAKIAGLGDDKSFQYATFHNENSPDQSGAQSAVKSEPTQLHPAVQSKSSPTIMVHGVQQQVEQIENSIGDKSVAEKSFVSNRSNIRNDAPRSVLKSPAAGAPTVE